MDGQDPLFDAPPRDGPRHELCRSPSCTRLACVSACVFVLVFVTLECEVISSVVSSMFHRRAALEYGWG